MNKKNQQVIDEFRANAGVVLVTPPHGPVLLLHTAGARTGHELITPLIYRIEGEAYVVAASMGGWKTNPAWYYNLLAHCNATIEVGTRRIEVAALVPEGAERERLFAQHSEAYPQFAYYQGKTKRQIPVIVLQPRTEVAVPQGLFSS
jgi:deazaflavin-dependent oxidoreductase (nitroreductase family)